MSGVRLIEPEQQADDRGLSRSAGPHQGDSGAGWNSEADVTKDGLVAAVAEIDMSERQLRLRTLALPRHDRRVRLARLLQQVQQALQEGDALRDVAHREPEQLQRLHEADDVGIDQNKVAD